MSSHPLSIVLAVNFPDHSMSKCPEYESHAVFKADMGVVTMGLTYLRY